MPATRATTAQQRQAIAELAQAGAAYHAIADEVGVSYSTVRKWARRAKHNGTRGLVSQIGRPKRGALSTFHPRVRYVALRLKRQHSSWGASYVLKKMRQRASLQAIPLPDPVTLWRYWRSFGDRLRPKRQPPDPKPPKAGVVHGVWQMDAKESVNVPGVGLTAFNQARDEFGRATVMHRVHPTESPEAKRAKPSMEHIQQDCRIAFTQWGLPDAIQTDRAKTFVEDGPTPFPTRLELWWLGLGIEHRLIPRHCPKRNGVVERAHRTLNERTLVGQHFSATEALQAQVDADWHELNAECPSRAKGCDGQPPLVAHPELLVPRRPYCPEWEADLFDLTRVDAHLAQRHWLRRVSPTGQVSLGGYYYGIGLPFASQTVEITFDPTQRQFVFEPLRPEPNDGPSLPQLAPVARSAQGLSVADITRLPTVLDELPSRQLMLPLLMCYPEASLPAA